MEHRWLIAAIVALIMATGCGNAGKYLVQVGGIDERDSLVIHVRDSVILRDSTVYVTVPNESETVISDSYRSHVSTSLAESDVYVEEGKIHHTIRNKAEALIPINITIPEKAHYEESTSRLVVTKTVEVEKELTAWQTLCLKTGRIAIFGLIALALVGLVTIIVKVLKMARK